MQHSARIVHKITHLLLTIWMSRSRFRGGAWDGVCSVYGVVFLLGIASIRRAMASASRPLKNRDSTEELAYLCRAKEVEVGGAAAGKTNDKVGATILTFSLTVLAHAKLGISSRMPYPQAQIVAFRFLLQDS